jgi:hypothetical protein
MKTLKEIISEAKIFSSDLRPEIDSIVKNCPLNGNMDSVDENNFKTVLNTLADMDYRITRFEPAIDPNRSWQCACFYVLCKGDSTADMALVACFLRFGRFTVTVYTNKKSNITLEKRTTSYSGHYSEEDVSDIAVSIKRADVVSKVQVNGQENLYSHLTKAGFGSISKFIEKANWYTKAAYYSTNDHGYLNDPKKHVKLYSVCNFYE